MFFPFPLITKLPVLTSFNVAASWFEGELGSVTVKEPDGFTK
jgi:hypothetical protein